jgi:hypothetical protein
MTELKTLKDFPNSEISFGYFRKEKWVGNINWYNGYETCKKQLKKEAIKWMKFKGTCSYFPNCNKNCAKLNIDDWMNFFNITYEDLKDEN